MWIYVVLMVKISYDSRSNVSLMEMREISDKDARSPPVVLV